MQLHDAAKAVCKFAGNKKSAPHMQCVRMLPAVNGYPPRLFASNGVISMFAKVDVGDLPDALIPAEDLSQIGRESAVIGLWDEPSRMLIQTHAGMFVMRKADPNAFPPTPPVPSFLEPVEEWPTIAKVVHAAGEIPGRPELGHVHFYRDRVEATDSTRLAMADVLTPVEAKAPAEMFRYWPKKELVWAAVDYGWVYFRVGDELRLATNYVGKSPDCREYLGKEHVGGFMVVDTKAVLDAAKKAFRVDPIVRMQFGIGSVHVSGRVHGSQKEFYAHLHDKDSTTVEGHQGSTAGEKGSFPTLNLDGQKLIDAFKVIDTPRVRLCYREDEHPLRLESGGYVEVIATLVE
jgi:hypothetical protein